MANWSVIGTGIGDVEGKNFGVNLDTDTKKWTAGGGSVEAFFATKSGTFKVVGIPENGTQFVNPAGKEVAFFTALNGSSAVGSTGKGRSSERGVTFNWKLDSK
ncbi:hypothetical protein PY32053_01283 [Paracoccus yeei]|uniref:Uncharacterized protein n=1 Tax=Paracoccus yeei TaxID=147645 RepID=A0A386UJQ5_9RHOB|nr:hypothetical protein [Paracoccus yeei]AYF00924.1 hypothetical protein PY32053_01283 [Paracoccus yeei]